MANGRFLLWLKNVLKVNTIPGYMADFDKTRADSVFYDNYNRIMEVNNLQEGLVQTQYHGLKASILDGQTQYWSKALPTNILTNGTFETGVNTDGWAVGGTAVWNDTETGKTGNYCLKLTGSAGIITKSGILTIGKKYKLAIRYKSINSLQVRNSGSGSTYVSFGATSQWNQIYYTFTATSTDIVLRINSDTAWIDDISIVEDWKMDLNESYELIKHSINRDFEQTLVTTYASNFSAGVDGWAATAGAVAGNIDSIAGENDCLKFTADSTLLSTYAWKSFGQGAGKKYIIKSKVYIPSTNAVLKRVRLFGNAGWGTHVITTTDAWVSFEYETIIADNYATRFIGLTSGSMDISDGSANGDVFYLKDVQVLEIPNLVTNGSLTNPVTEWTAGTGCTFTGGVAQINNVAVASATSFCFRNLGSFTIGKRLRLSFEIKNYSSGSLSGNLGGTGTAIPNTNSNGVKTFDFVQGTNSNGYFGFYLSAGGTFVGDIDNIHIYELVDYVPSKNAQVATNNHYVDITTLDKFAGTSALKMTTTGAGRSAELLANGTFTDATGWGIEAGTPTWTISGGTLNGNGVSGAKAAYNTTLAGLSSGDTVEVTGTITNRTVGYFNIKVGYGVGGTVQAISANGAFIARVVVGASGTNTLYFDGFGFDGSVDNVSVKKVQGEVSLPYTQMETLVVGNKYTKEIYAKLDPTSLTYTNNATLSNDGSAIGSWTATRGTASIESGSIKFVGDSNMGNPKGIQFNNGAITGKTYRVRFKAWSATCTASIRWIARSDLAQNQTTATEPTVVISSPALTTTSQNYEYYAKCVTTGHFSLGWSGDNVPDGSVIYYDDIIIDEVDTPTLTSQIGTKLVTVTPSIAGYTKTVLNFEATSGEVNQDLKLYLNGAGSVFVDAISLTQKYDIATAMVIKKNGDTGAEIIYPSVNSLTAPWQYIFWYNSSNTHNLAFGVNGSFGSYPVTANPDIYHYAISTVNWTDKASVYLNNVLANSVTVTNVASNGKAIADQNLVLMRRTNGSTGHYNGLVGKIQFIRFTNIGQSNFNPTTYKIGDAITGGGAEVVLWQDWSNITGAIALDKYRPETTVRNDLTAYGSPLASGNVVTVKEYSPQTKKLRQSSMSLQPTFNSVSGFVFNGTNNILLASQNFGDVKTIVLKIKVDTLESEQDLLQLNDSTVLTLNTDGSITATGFIEETIKIQTTLLADALITTDQEYLVCVKSGGGISTDSFKLGGSSTYLKGNIKKVTLFSTELDDATIQKIFKSIRSI